MPHCRWSNDFPQTHHFLYFFFLSHCTDRDRPHVRLYGFSVVVEEGIPKSLLQRRRGRGRSRLRRDETFYTSVGLTILSQARTDSCSFLLA